LNPVEAAQHQIDREIDAVSYHRHVRDRSIDLRNILATVLVFSLLAGAILYVILAEMN
jgi:hypothetical protein